MTANTAAVLVINISLINFYLYLIAIVDSVIV
jgi:hypothetical protein